MEEELGKWVEEVARNIPEVGELLRRSASDRDRLGYSATLGEILQQPLVWLDTAQRALALRSAIDSLVRGPAERPPQTMMLTGSGSSLHAGECLAPGLQRRLGIPVRAVASGDLLSHQERASLPGRLRVLVSVARSGNSPESAAVLGDYLRSDPECRHLIITCNREGRLAAAGVGDPRVLALVLHERTNDRSLVMTSSFTSMVVAGRLIARLDESAGYQSTIEQLSRAAREILLRHVGALARAARDGCRFAVYLGAGSRHGAARESALKMVEMTAGRVRTMAETCLGLRHGPMSAVHPDTHVVCFLSSSEPARAYELDLLAELNRKGLGGRRFVVGAGIPAEVLREDDVALECSAAAGLSDDDFPVIDTLVGQLLAFFKCRAVGLRPDSPSPDGVITRVVESFRLHRPER